ncbi:MAG: apolipoprotein N-acyltransferase [Actinomycetes bacterium]
MSVLEAATPAAEPPASRRTSHLGWASTVAGSSGLAAAAGVGVGLAFPPYDIWWLAPVAIASLLLLLHACRTPVIKRTVGMGALIGAAFGLTFFGLLTPWLRVIGWDAYGLVVAMSVAFMAVFGTGAVLIVRIPGWPVWVACWWVAIEDLRGRIPFGGFPWGRIGQSQVDAPYVAWVAIGGVPMLTFMVVLSSAFGAWAVVALVDRHRVPAALGLGLASLTILSGLAIATPTSGQQVNVAVVQGNVSDTGMDAFGRREAVLDAHLAATHELAAEVRSGSVDAPDVVIWPENASDIDPSLNQDAFDKISAAVADIGVPVLVGLVVDVDGGEHVANEGTVWDPTSGPGETYVKQNLVPFGEYVPLRGLLENFISRLDRIPRDFVAGDVPGDLKLGPVTVADVICFDVAYDDAVRGAVADGGELITVQTNNATYGHTGQAEQQWAISRLRAIEHARSVVVASTSGISGVIAPDGTVQARAPEFERATIVAPVATRTSETLATRLGAWPGWVMTFIGFGALGVSIVVEVRRRGRVAA